MFLEIVLIVVFVVAPTFFDMQKVLRKKTKMVKNNFLYTFSDLDTMGVNLDTLEVIGNIHENPELLEEK